MIKFSLAEWKKLFNLILYHSFSQIFLYEKELHQPLYFSLIKAKIKLFLHYHEFLAVK